MPEVITVKWDGAAYKVDRPGWNGGKVLTLDQLVMFIENNRRTLSHCASVAHMKWENKVIDDLLAQVQAWKEGK